MAIIELSDYERWKADQAQRTAAGANVVLGSIDTNPDEVAGDMTLGQDFAKVTGKPVPPLPMVTEYRPVFQQAIERSRNATILSSSPMLADWLKKPENAALAKDDLEGLSWFETTMGAGSNALKRGVARVPQAANQMLAFGASERLADEGRTFGEILSDRTTIRGSDGEVLGNKTVPGPDDLYFAGARYLQSRLMPLLGMDAEEAAVGYQQAAGEIAQRIAEMPMSPAGSRYRDVFAGLEDTGSVGGDFSQFVSTVADDPAGFLAFISEVAAESIPMLGATAVVGAATRNPTAAAAFMGTMSGATEAGVAPMEFFQERGVDVSTPEGALAAVMDVDLMREAQKRGVLRGVVIGALDGISGGVAGQTLAKSPVGNAVLQSVTQAFLGGLGEASAQVAAGQDFNLNDVIIEALAEFVTAPIEVAAVGAGQFVRGQRAARDAETRQALFQELSGQAVNSKLRARMPDAFRQFLERATENGPVENVFVPADKFTEYFQGIGVDPYALVDELDGVNADALRDALATGGDLQIPTATYAASIAGSEHDAFLMENMRFDPDEFTSAEARAFNERAGDALNEAYAEAERMRAEDERFKSFEAEIYDTMVERLRIAGRSTDVATNEAMLYPAFYRVMAERSGLTIEEFMQRYPLPQVRGELPQGVQSREVDSLTRTLAEARSYRSTGQTTQRTPLLEFISNYGGIEDRGGELRARDAVEIRRGRGRSTLRLARDTSGEGQATMFGAAQAGRAYGPDDVAQAAIEAGLMADNPVVQEYQAAIREGRQIPDITRALWDEIDNELRGQASMTADDMNADVSDDDRMQALEEYLSQIGVSLDDDDAVIREAVARDQDERGAMYGQDGRIATDSEAFKAWFGDSKVVGPDGEPLVVYHGTRKAGFMVFDTEGQGKTSGTGAFFTQSKRGASTYSGTMDDANPIDAQMVAENPEKYGFTVMQDGDDWSVTDPDGYEYISTDREQAIVESASNWINDSQGAQDGNYAVYLSIQNPKIIDAGGQNWDSIGGKEWFVEDADGNGLEYFTDQDALDDFLANYDGDVDDLNIIESNDNPDGASTDDLVREAREEGYDGVIFENITDEGPFGQGYGWDDKIYVAFTPTQIKSVNNRGTFDASDPRILYQGADPVGSDAFRAWAGTDAPVIEPSEINETDFSRPGPFVVRGYHGTTHDFDQFQASIRGNREGQFGAVNYFTSSEADASGNYGDAGPDLTNMIERRAEELENEIYDDPEAFGLDPDETEDADFRMARAREIARSELSGGEPRTLEVFIRTEKPFVVGGDQSPFMEFMDFDALDRQAIERVAENEGVTVEEVEENRDDYEDQIDDARYEVEAEAENPLIVAVQAVADRYDFDASELFSELYEITSEGVTHDGLEKALRSSEALGYAEDPETGALIGYQMLAEVIKELGFDSIILKNADARFSTMDMEPGTAHIHVFDDFNTNIKSVQNRGTFDRNDPVIYNQPAYHGSPHLFERFSLNAIGTGEGAQAFGWGLYFAGRREVAEYYKTSLANGWSLNVRDPIREAGITGRDLDSASQMLSTSFSGAAAAADWENWTGKTLTPEQRAAFDVAFDRKGGRLFEVNIPEDAELLDWDAPLSEQPEGVREKFSAVLRDANVREWFAQSKDGYQIGLLIGHKTEAEAAEDAAKSTVNGGVAVNIQDMPAERAYNALSRMMGSDQAASEALRAAGIPGHRYLDGGSRADGDGSRNYVIYDEDRISVTRFEQEQRGSIQFPGGGVGNGDTVISLFRSADLSTLMHESGHYFLTVMQDMAQRGEPAAADEFQTVKDWWRSNAADVARDAMRVMPDVTVTEADVITALDNGTTGDVLKDAAIDVGMQEQFARGFEAYLMEGKAPSQALRGAFEKFRAWLLSVYKSLRGLNVEVSPEIRAVFDRMLATDDEIANAAEASGNLGSIFASAEDMGLTADDYAAFLRLSQQAEDEASQKLLAETMAPIQRETEKWFKDERTKVRAEVERNINAQRHYRAWEWMGNRRWLGGETPQGLADMRMSKDMLVARYGAGVLKTLPRGKQTLYAVDGGVDPDVAADVFGFSSGDEMIRVLERAVPRKEAIEAETDRVMFERHGDPLADGTVQRMALDAVHGDKRARTLAVELKALTDVAGSDRGITHKEAREIARQTLSRTKVRDAMAANRYLTAERKAGEEAQRLAATVTRTGMWMDAARRKVGVQARAGVREGDTAAPARVAGQVGRANTSTPRYKQNVQKLIEAKRRQLLNHAMYAEARRISTEVESAERLVARLQKKSTREKLAGDYLEAIDELLQRYDFRKISGRAEDRRGALLAYVERMTAEGRENELAIPDRVLQDAQRTPYKKITVEHLRGVVDSLKNIEHTARLKRTLQDAQSQRELDAVVEDIVGAFDKNLPKRPPARVGDNAEGRRKSVRGFLDLVLNATTLLREIDGFEDMGAAYRNLKSPIDAAMNRLQERRQKAAGDLDALYEVYTKQERRAMAVREFIPEIDASLSKWERIAVALNMGNEGNYQRLTDTKVRGGFTEPQVAAIVATLDERDAAFIQTVWDYLETFRPDIEAREKRATGVAPKWVEARPVEIAGRTLKGGYYPLRYDPRLSSLARDDATQDIAKSLQAGRFGKAQTRNGHLKERAQSSGRAVELDIAVLHKHVQQVVYDIELSEPVNNSWRILQDARIRDAFMNAGKQADFDALEIWLKDVAEGELMAADVAGRMARRLKSNFTAAKLAFNLSTVAVQITGVAQSMVVVGKKDFLGGVVASMRPGVMDEIASKSQFMNDRQTTFNKDIFDLYNDPKLGPVASRWTEVRNDWIAPMGLWLMTKVQFYLVDMPTWLAGYQQGLRKFGAEDQAVAYADDVVKRAQASGLFSDRSSIERGSANMRTRQNEFLRLFTTLGSYMFAKFNVAYERTGRAQRVISSEGATLASVREAASWTIDMAFLFALEAVMYAAIKGRLPDEEDDEEGDGLGDEWAGFVARETALSIAATIPFVRDVSSVIGGFSGGGAYGAITEELARPFQQAGQGEIDAPLVKSIINVTGLATGIPSGQINRAVDAGWRAAEGEDVSPAEYLLGRMGN